MKGLIVLMTVFILSLVLYAPIALAESTIPGLNDDGPIFYGVQRHIDVELWLYDDNYNLRDVAFVYLGYGGNTSQGRYKFILYYDVTDVDENQFDDEHVYFFTKWYYWLQHGSGGGGGGIPMSTPSFLPPIMNSWRPETGDDATEFYVTVSIENLGVSFPIRLNGWNAVRHYDEDYGNPSVWLFQESGWIIGSDYGYAQGANAVKTDPCKWYAGRLYGPRLYFYVGVEHDDELVGEQWWIPAGLLALGDIGQPGQ